MKGSEKIVTEEMEEYLQEKFKDYNINIERINVDKFKIYVGKNRKSKKF